MLPKALNQMTVPTAPVAEVFALAKTLGCQGVELRNDLGRPLCDGLPADAIKEMAAETGQDILAVAEVKAFNHRPTDRTEDTTALINFAAKIGAKGVALIPHVGDAQVDRGAQRDGYAQTPDADRATRNIVCLHRYGEQRGLCNCGGKSDRRSKRIDP